MIGVTNSNMSASRLMRHPGPVAPVRINSRCATSSCSAQIVLASSVSLQKGLIAVMAELAPGHNCPAGSFEFVSGWFEQVSYCTGMADKSGKKLATYSSWQLARYVHLLGGAGTFGWGLDRKPFVHCHGFFVGTQGNVGGGHLDPKATFFGQPGARLRLFVHSQFSIHQQPDAETRHAVLMPVNRQEYAV